MKKIIILILMMFIFESNFARIHHHHHHHVNANRRELTHHNLNVHPYKTIKNNEIKNSDIHRQTSKKMLYYYLIFNHNTKVNDTIFAKNQKELKKKICDISKDPNDNIGYILVFLFFIPFLIIALLISNYKWSKKY